MPGWVGFNLGDIPGAGIWLFTCVVELVSLFGVAKVVLHSGLRLTEPSLCTLICLEFGLCIF